MKETVTKKIVKVWSSILIMIALYALIATLMSSSQDFFLGFPILFFFGLFFFAFGIVFTTEYYLSNILKLRKKAKPFKSVRKLIVEDILFLGDGAFVISELMVYLQLAMIETKPLVFYIAFIFLAPVLLVIKRAINSKNPY